VVVERRVEVLLERRDAELLGRGDDIVDAGFGRSGAVRAVMSPWLLDVRPGLMISTWSSGRAGLSMSFNGLVSQSELIGVLFSVSIQARYTAGLKEEPGWCISATWSMLPATRTSETQVGSMFGTYTTTSPVAGSMVITAPLWQLHPAARPEVRNWFSSVEACWFMLQSSVLVTL
jgi:hypothetical protein